MNNRLAVSLAVAGGYVLGRTRKAKLALGIGTMVLGKRLKLDPKQIVSGLTEQVAANPQLAEAGRQLRGDLTGAGRAATGALVTRQLNSLADSLHQRTTGVRDRLDPGGITGSEEEDGEQADEPDAAADQDSGEEAERPGKRAAKKTARRSAESGGTAGRKAAGARDRTSGTPRKTATRTAKKAADKPAGKRSAPRKTTGRRRTAERSESGGGDRG